MVMEFAPEIVHGLPKLNLMLDGIVSGVDACKTPAPLMLTWLVLPSAPLLPRMSVAAFKLVVPL